MKKELPDDKKDMFCDMRGRKKSPGLLVYLIIAVTLTSSFHARCQNLDLIKIDVHVQQVTIPEALHEIQKQSGIKYVYGPDMTEYASQKVSISQDGISVNEATRLILRNTNLKFTQKNDHLIIEKRKENTSLPKVKARVRPGTVIGKILDADSGEPLIGSAVVVKNINTGGVADLDGKYAIALPPGSYDLEFRYVGYETRLIRNVSIREDEITALDVTLKADANTLREVVVTDAARADTEAGLFVLQKKSAVMSDGISERQLAKTPDSDVAQALKRITGVTTVDNKYVVVRSMGERWNTAAMDGINLPSTEAYNNNFSFDIIPTAMVEGIVVSKTATPDMNVSFAGGLVEIKTKDMPDQNFTTLSIAGGYNDISTGKTFITHERGRYDYLGYDDGTRDLPQHLQPMDWNNPLFFEQSRQFTNDNFSHYRTNGKPNSSFQFAIGRNYALKGNNRWGFAGALTLRNEQSKVNIDHTGRGGWMDNAGLIQNDTTAISFYRYKNKGASYSYNATSAAMLNFGFQVGRNRLSFRNAYTHIYDNTLTMVTGWDEYSSNISVGGADDSYDYFYHGIIPDNDISQLPALSMPIQQNTDYPIYQTLWQNKLEGNHPVGHTEINWFASHTAVSADTKDYTQNDSFYKTHGDEIYLYNRIYNSSDDFTRGYITSRETDYNYGVSIKWSLNTRSLKNEFKVGYAGVLKQNTNKQEKFFLRVDENRDVPQNEKNFIDLYGSLYDWFNGTHYAPGGIGWLTKPLYKENKYEGKVTQHAPFMMFDNRLVDKFRLVWGVRAEYFRYDLISMQLDPDDPRNVIKEEVKDKPWQWMPSANFTYSPTDKINLRLAYNKAVLRPQFNERTGLPYFDPISNALIYNIALTSSTVNNYDFKFEYFLTPGEVISVATYYKDMARPIEREGYVSQEGNLFLYNLNSKSATLKGIEIEVRKNLGFIKGHSFLRNLNLSGNFTYNDTRIISFKNRYRTDDSDETYKVNRPLYGQTPWAYNLAVTYEGDRLGLSFLYNAKGDQYVTVGYAYSGEEIQRPYAVADVQLSYRMLKNKNLEIKLNVRNIFNRVREYYNNLNSYAINSETGSTHATEREMYRLAAHATDKYDEDYDRITFRAYTGRTLGLSVKYAF